MCVHVCKHEQMNIYIYIKLLEKMRRAGLACLQEQHLLEFFFFFFSSRSIDLIFMHRSDIGAHIHTYIWVRVRVYACECDGTGGGGCINKNITFISVARRVQARLRRSLGEEAITGRASMCVKSRKIISWEATARSDSESCIPRKMSPSIFTESAMEVWKWWASSANTELDMYTYI